MKSLLRLRSSISVLRRTTQSVPRRHAHVMYRDVPTPPKYIDRIATAMMAATWFWVLWRFYHEPGDVTGHNPYPDPSKWTDQELGIPPDHED